MQHNLEGGRGEEGGGGGGGRGKRRRGRGQKDEDKDSFSGLLTQDGSSTIFSSLVTVPIC